MILKLGTDEVIFCLVLTSQIHNVITSEKFIVPQLETKLHILNKFQTDHAHICFQYKVIYIKK